METAALKGKVQTVLGLVDGCQLGFTLPHEHFLINCSVDFVEPTNPRDKELAHQSVSLENLSWVRSHRFSNVDNFCLSDVQMAISEARLFKEAGGKTIVDVTPNHMGRDPRILVHIAQAAGINVVMGTAYYTEPSYREEMDMNSKTEENIAEEFMRDITLGVDGTGIRAGIIGEIGCSWPLTYNEHKVLRAAAIAQKRTGLAISIHPGAYDEAPLEIVKMLTEAGVDPGRVIIGHMERTVESHSARFRLAETGCFLEWDCFGTDGEYPLVLRPSHNKLVDYPNDVGRLNQIIQIIGEGHLNQILVSQDVWIKINLTHFGGGGYAHILNNVLPLMQQKGISDKNIRTITIDNPRRALMMD